MYLPVPPGGSVINLAPNTAQLALFVDATVVKGGRQAGGAVIKDSTGKVVAQRSWSFEGATLDSTLAEANALEAGLNWLKECGPDLPTVVYMDSYQVLEHLQKQGAGRYPVLARVREALSATPVVRLQNIERKRNREADAAAKAGLMLH